MKIVSSILLALCLLLTAPFALSKIERGDVVDVKFGKDQNGQVIDIKDLKDKVVVVVFWSTNKADSITLLQDFEQIQRSISSEKLRVIAVNHKDKRKIFNKIVKKFSDFQSSFVHDKSGKYGRKFGFDRAPGLLMINKNGELKQVSKSYKKDQLNKRVEQLNRLLKEKNKQSKRSDLKDK